jgi:proline dehydrogenase
MTNTTIAILIRHSSLVIRHLEHLIQCRSLFIGYTEVTEEALLTFQGHSLWYNATRLFAALYPIYLLLKEVVSVRALLLFLANREGFKNFVLRFKVFQNAAWRFVAGETLDDAIRAVREANRLRIRGTLDLLGENTYSREDARNATQEVVTMLDCLHAEKVDCNVSVKLTQLGLDLDTDFCRANLLSIVSRARGYGSFVRVDMEDSHYTQRTLDVVLAVHGENSNVGTVLQSYLYRTEQDVTALLKAGVTIRLCKGAYLEPESAAFKKKSDTDANFIRITKQLLESGLYHAIATHDEAIIEATREFATTRKISKDRFEFQMLYGVRRDLQQKLAEDGHNVRIYIPYGKRWYPYFMRRLAERPANLVFVLRNFFKG